MAADKSVRLIVNADNLSAKEKIAEIKAKYEELKAEVDSGKLDISMKQLNASYGQQLRSAAKDLFSVGEESGRSSSKLQEMNNSLRDVQSGIPIIGGLLNAVNKLGSGITSLIPGVEEGGSAIGGMGAEAAVALPLIAGLVGAVTTFAGAAVTGFAAAGLGLGAFVALALPSLHQVEKALGKTGKGVKSLPPYLRPLAEEFKGIRTEWDAMARAFEPTVFGLVAQALGIVSQNLHYISPLANSFAKGLSEGMTMFGNALKQPWFRQFMGQMTQLAGPVVKAVMSGLIGITKDVAQLMSHFSQKDVINAINIAFRVLGGTINLLSGIIMFAMDSWDNLTQHGRTGANVLHNIAHDVDNVRGVFVGFGHVLRDIGSLFVFAWSRASTATAHGIDRIEGFVRSIPGRIRNALGNLGSLLWNAGVQLLGGFLGGIENKWHDVTNFVSGIAGWIAAHKGPIELDAVLLRPHGLAIMGGLVTGLQDGMPSLSRQLTKTTSTIGNTRVAGGLGASGAAVKVEFDWGPNADGDIISAFKKAIRVRGGNPAVLGR